MILDTSFIVDLMNGDDAAVAKLAEMKDQGIEPRVTSITAHELHVGARKVADSEKEMKRIRSALQELSGTKRPFSWEDGVESARILGSLRDKGAMVELPDVFIGAIARRTNDSVLTDNAKHFDRIEGVEAESY